MAQLLESTYLNPENKSRRLKILVVEDEDIEREALVLMLRCTRFQPYVQQAGNGISALDIYRAFIPDLVLMDINLPGIDGINTIQQMKQIHPGSVFVIVTAYDRFDYAKTAIRLEVMDYLLKPIHVAEVERILQETEKTLHQKEVINAENNKQSLKDKTLFPILEMTVFML